MITVWLSDPGMSDKKIEAESLEAAQEAIKGVRTHTTATFQRGTEYILGGSREVGSDEWTFVRRCRKVQVETYTVKYFMSEWDDEGDVKVLHVPTGATFEGLWRKTTSGPETGDATLLSLEIPLPNSTIDKILKASVEALRDKWGVDSYQRLV